MPQIDRRLRLCGALLASWIAAAGGCANGHIGDDESDVDAARSVDGVDACAPLCDGRVCGPDGCGGTCAPGCAGDQTCSAAGRCEPSCAEVWTASVAGITAYRVVLDPGNDLYVAGVDTTEDRGWLGAFASCDGSVRDTAQVDVSGVISSGLYGVALSGDNLFAFGSATFAGDDGGEGMYVRLGKDTLEVQWAVPIAGSSGQDEGWDIAATASGNLWMVGVANLASPNPWAIKGTQSSQACGFAVNDGQGFGRAVATDGDSVYVSGDLRRWRDPGPALRRRRLLGRRPLRLRARLVVADDRHRFVLHRGSRHGGDRWSGVSGGLRARRRGC